MNISKTVLLKAIIQNLAIEYQDEGNGPVLLCLHGWKDNLHTFDQLTTLLSKTHRIIRLDLPGFGKSEIPTKAWFLDDYVDFVKHFIDKLKIKPEFMLGHSFGGRIIIKGQTTKALNAKKLILIASAGIAHNQKLKKLLLKTLAKTGKIVTSIPPFSSLKEKLRTKLYDKIGSDYLSAGPLKETFINIVREDLQNIAKRINCPTLLIWGTNDSETPLEDGKRLTSLINNSTLNIIDNASHFVHREHPQKVAHFIETFLS